MRRSPRRSRRAGSSPPIVISMIAVREQTCRLVEMLSKMDDFHNEEVDALFKSACVEQFDREKAKADGVVLFHL